MCQLTSPLLIIYIAVKPCMLYFELLFCSRPRALAARVYYVKLLPTWNKDYLSIIYGLSQSWCAFQKKVSQGTLSWCHSTCIIQEGGYVDLSGADSDSLFAENFLSNCAYVFAWEFVIPQGIPDTAKAIPLSFAQEECEQVTITRGMSLEKGKVVNILLKICKVRSIFCLYFLKLRSCWPWYLRVIYLSDCRIYCIQLKFGVPKKIVPPAGGYLSCFKFAHSNTQTKQ